MSSRRQQLENAVLYLVCGERSDEFLHAALAGGVDLIQLRMKAADDDRILAAASRFARVCRQHGALLIINDRPDLVAAARADGAHVGQGDVLVPEARALIGAERLLGLSTHSPEQIDAAAALGEDGPDYIGVGPVHRTPTKPGRPAVGLELVSYAAAHAHVPFFAIGGISIDNAATVRAAGARRVAVVRALTEADHPGEVAHSLRAAIAEAAREVPVGST